MKITLYLDGPEDAERALLAVKKELAETRDRPIDAKRRGALWSGNDDWHALVWGTPSHMRVDARRQ